MIQGTIEVKMSLEEANYYNALEERDKAKSIRLKTYDFVLENGKTPSPSELCPSCGETVHYMKGEFCPMCGQRLDRENIEI